MKMCAPCQSRTFQSTPPHASYVGIDVMGTHSYPAVHTCLCVLLWCSKAPPDPTCILLHDRSGFVKVSGSEVQRGGCPFGPQQSWGLMPIPRCRCDVGICFLSSIETAVWGQELSPSLDLYSTTRHTFNQGVSRAL